MAHQMSVSVIGREHTHTFDCAAREVAYLLMVYMPRPYDTMRSFAPHDGHPSGNKPREFLHFNFIAVMSCNKVFPELVIVKSSWVCVDGNSWIIFIDRPHTFHQPQSSIRIVVAKLDDDSHVHELASCF